MTETHGQHCPCFAELTAEVGRLRSVVTLDEDKVKATDLQLRDCHKLLDIARELLSENGGSPGTVREIRDLLKRHKTSEKRKPIFIFCSGCGSQQKDCKCT